MAVRIARTSTGLYASKAKAGAPKLRIASLEDLGDRPLLAYSPPFHMLQEAPWVQPLLAAGRVALETNSTHVLLSAARDGAGVAVLPRFVGRAHNDLVPVSENVAEQDVWLTTHPESRRDPKYA